MCDSKYDYYGHESEDVHKSGSFAWPEEHGMIERRERRITRDYL